MKRLAANAFHVVQAVTPPTSPMEVRTMPNQIIWDFDESQ
jgi:hypothetical protein